MTAVEPRLRLFAHVALPGAMEHWRYSGGKRDLRLDLLRGFAAFAMIVDHVGGEHSWLYAFTGGNRFFVSAAEAFVLISGVVLGIVYLGVVQRLGIAAALMKALHRAWMLYVATVLLSLGLAALTYLLDLAWVPAVREDGIWRFVLDVATLHRTVYLADVLLMYTLLLLLAGPVILLLSQGYTAVVLAGSWLVWALWQFAPQSSSLFWEIRGNEVFNLSPWQVIFVTGIVIGWHRQAIESSLAAAPRWLTGTALGFAVIVVPLLYVAQVTQLERLQSNALLETLAFDKPDLVVGRLAVLMLLAVVAFALASALWVPVKRSVGWLLLPLGQHALAAYSLHLFVVAGIAKALTAAPAEVSGSAAVVTVLQLGAVAVVWLVVRFESGVRDALRRVVPHVVWHPLASVAGLPADLGRPRA